MEYPQRVEIMWKGDGVYDVTISWGAGVYDFLTGLSLATALQEIAEFVANRKKEEANV